MLAPANLSQARAIIRFNDRQLRSIKHVRSWALDPATARLKVYTTGPAVLPSWLEMSDELFYVGIDIYEQVPGYLDYTSSQGDGPPSRGQTVLRWLRRVVVCG